MQTPAPLHPEVTIHRSSDWCMVTDGDRTIDEGHVDDVMERLLYRFVNIRDLKSDAFADRGFKTRMARPAQDIPATEVFALEEV